MSRAWLSLGANIGHPTDQLKHAVARLNTHPEIKVEKQSSILINPAWGKTDQPDFHNQVIEITTQLLPIALLNTCQNIEADMGRKRIKKWGPRLIDIDIIAFDRLQMQTKGLTLPHSHAHERDFVLDPLREIASDVADWVIEIAGSTPDKNK